MNEDFSFESDDSPIYRQQYDERVKKKKKQDEAIVISSSSDSDDFLSEDEMEVEDEEEEEKASVGRDMDADSVDSDPGSEEDEDDNSEDEDEEDAHQDTPKMNFEKVMELAYEMFGHDDDEEEEEEEEDEEMTFLRNQGEEKREQSRHEIEEKLWEKNEEEEEEEEDDEATVVPQVSPSLLPRIPSALDSDGDVRTQGIKRLRSFDTDSEDSFSDHEVKRAKPDDIFLREVIEAINQRFGEMSSERAHEKTRDERTVIYSEWQQLFAKNALYIFIPRDMTVEEVIHVVNEIENGSKGSLHRHVPIESMAPYFMANLRTNSNEEGPSFGNIYKFAEYATKSKADPKYRDFPALRELYERDNATFKVYPCPTLDVLLRVVREERGVPNPPWHSMPSKNGTNFVFNAASLMHVVSLEGAAALGCSDLFSRFIQEERDGFAKLWNNCLRFNRIDAFISYYEHSYQQDLFNLSSDEVERGVDHAYDRSAIERMLGAIDSPHVWSMTRVVNDPTSVKAPHIFSTYLSAPNYLEKRDLYNRLSRHPSEFQPFVMHLFGEYEEWGGFTPYQTRPLGLRMLQWQKNPLASRVKQQSEGMLLKFLVLTLERIVDNDRWESIPALLHLLPQAAVVEGLRIVFRDNDRCVKSLYSRKFRDNVAQYWIPIDYIVPSYLHALGETPPEANIRHPSMRNVAIALVKERKEVGKFVWKRFVDDLGNVSPNGVVLAMYSMRHGLPTVLKIWDNAKSNKRAGGKGGKSLVVPSTDDIVQNYKALQPSNFKEIYIQYFGEPLKEIENWLSILYLAIKYNNVEAYRVVHSTAARRLFFGVDANFNFFVKALVDTPPSRANVVNDVLVEFSTILSPEYKAALCAALLFTPHEQMIGHYRTMEQIFLRNGAAFFQRLGGDPTILSRISDEDDIDEEVEKYGTLNPYHLCRIGRLDTLQILCLAIDAPALQHFATAAKSHGKDALFDLIPEKAQYQVAPTNQFIKSFGPFLWASTDADSLELVYEDDTYFSSVDTRETGIYSPLLLRLPNKDFSPFAYDEYLHAGPISIKLRADLDKLRKKEEDQRKEAEMREQIRQQKKEEREEQQRIKKKQRAEALRKKREEKENAKGKAKSTKKKQRKRDFLRKYQL